MKHYEKELQQTFTPEQMFDHLRICARVPVVEQPFLGRGGRRKGVEQIIASPPGYVLRVENGSICWTHLSRRVGRKGEFVWYRLQGAPGKAARHVHDSTSLVLQEAPAP